AETSMPDAKSPEQHVQVPLAPEVGTTRLLGLLAHKGSDLVKAEVELARAELKADLKDEIGMAKGLGVAGVCALITLTLLLVALAMGLAEKTALHSWSASLLVAGVVAAIGMVAGLVGW